MLSHQHTLYQNNDSTSQFWRNQKAVSDCSIRKLIYLKLAHNSAALLCVFHSLVLLDTSDWQLKLKVPEQQETLLSLSLTNINIFMSWPLLVLFLLEIFLELFMWDLCLQTILIGTDCTQKAYLGIMHKVRM